MSALFKSKIAWYNLNSRNLTYRAQILRIAKNTGFSEEPYDDS